MSEQSSPINSQTHPKTKKPAPATTKADIALKDVREHNGIKKILFLFFIGFVTYITIEVIYRGYSHWSMGILGGLCFLLIGKLNQKCTWKLDLLVQMLLSAAIVSLLELIAGLILNRWLGLGIWDYTNLKFNFMGQISLVYSLLWIPLSLVAIYLDDWMRHYVFKEARPHYSVLGHKFGDWENCGCP